jgi:hypothetical protein
MTGTRLQHEKERVRLSEQKMTERVRGCIPQIHYSDSLHRNKGNLDNFPT